MTIIKKSDLMDFADALYFLKEGKTVKQKDFPPTYKLKGQKIFRHEEGHTDVVITSINTKQMLAEDWVVLND